MKPSFISVYANYHLNATHLCSMSFPKACAIRMSEALAKADSMLLSVFKFSGKNICPHG